MRVDGLAGGSMHKPAASSYSGQHSRGNTGNTGNSVSGLPELRLPDIRHPRLFLHTTFRHDVRLLQNIQVSHQKSDYVIVKMMVYVSENIE